MIWVVTKFGENWIAFSVSHEAQEWIDQQPHPGDFEVDMVELR